MRKDSSSQVNPRLFVGTGANGTASTKNTNTAFHWVESENGRKTHNGFKETYKATPP